MQILQAEKNRSFIGILIAKVRCTCLDIPTISVYKKILQHNWTLWK